jgi:hypothetical protein
MDMARGQRKVSLSDQGPPRREPVSLARVHTLLAQGEIQLQGRVVWSSNNTFLATVRDAELQTLAIYKPSAGERPLWDFPQGTLCQREVASYLVSHILGWPEVPPVVLRDGPYGVGSLQLYVDVDGESHYFSMRGQPAYEQAFRHIVLFDYLVNNADRKGGHVLEGKDGKVWAIDHGLTLHEDFKLRTVIWEYEGQPIAAELLSSLEALRAALQTDQPLAQALGSLLTSKEIEATQERLDALLESGLFPKPLPDQRNVPYPLI